MSTKKAPDFTQHEVLSASHDALRDSVEFVQKEIIPVLNGLLNIKTNEEAVVGLFYVMHCLATSGTRLNNKLDFVSLAGSARTMFEILLDMKALADPKVSTSNLEKFAAFAEVDRFKKAQKLVALQSKHPSLVQDSFFDSARRKAFVDAAGKATAIEKKVEGLWGRTKKGKINWPDHWSGLNIRERAENFGPSYVQEYLEIYLLFCSYAHSGNSSYANLSPEALEGVYGIALKLMRQMYLESLLILSKVIPLPAGIESFSAIMNYLKEAPTHILREHGRKSLKAQKHPPAEA